MFIDYLRPHAFLYKANHNTKDVKVNTISVERVQAPALKKKLNILHLSDLHLENISISPERILELANKNEWISLL